MKVSERVRKRTHVPEDRLIENPLFPDDIKIELTARCNYHCKFCATANNLRQQGDMNIATYQEVLSQAWLNGVKEVGLFLLGEPFMRDDVAECVKMAKNEKFDYVYLTTNGSLCSREDIKKCMDAGLDSLKISLNSGDAESYYDVTGRDLFESVIKMIFWIAKNKNSHMNFCVSCVWDDDKSSSLLKIEQQMKDAGIDFYFLSMYNQGGEVTAPFCGNIGRKDDPVSAIPCWELFNTTRVTWDGFMSYCSFPHTDKFKIGNVIETPMIELWNSDEFRLLRRKHLTKLATSLQGTVCEKCVYG